jgi:uncharacterized cupin superfamily protein
MMSKNYNMTEIGAYAQFGEKGRLMLGELLGLTGCEISVNSYPAGKSSEFTHTHKLNEEVYIVISGSGQFKVDEDVFPIREGSIVRVAPAGRRAIRAGDDGLVYLCVQAEHNSLTQSTRDDGVAQQGPVSWA